MKTIITTVGTSLFENYMSSEVKTLFRKEGKNYPDISQAVKGLKNKDASTYAPTCTEIKDTISPAIKNLWLKGISKNRQGWLFTDNVDEPNQYASAEIESIIKIRKDIGEEVQVYLICTDTVLSVLAAELIKTFFNYKDFGGNEYADIEVVFEQTDKHIVKDLRVSDNDEYQKGFMNLVKITNEVINKEGKTNCYLNITGGYKAIIPVMTLVGQLKEVPLRYIYEDNENTEKPLVEIGNLPFNFDWSILEGYSNMLFDTTKIQGSKIQELENFGIVKKNIRPPELTIIGELLKIFLEQDIPFQKTTFGYLIEYKLMNYYLNNNYCDFSKVELGYPLSQEEGNKLEDADLWMENDEGKVVMVEVKPATFKSKKLKEKIKKNLSFVDLSIIEEFWVITYQYKDNLIPDDKFKSMIENIASCYAGVMFRVKKITIEPNEIDGDLNRVKYHDFMRSNLLKVDDCFSIKR